MSLRTGEGKNISHHTWCFNIKTSNKDKNKYQFIDSIQDPKSNWEGIIYFNGEKEEDV